MGLAIFAIICGIVVFLILLTCAFGLASEVTAGVVALVAMITFVLVGGVSLLNWGTTYRSDRTVTCHVTDKDRGGDNGSYRIYTSDCGQLSNEDSVLRWKQNSADYWQKIPTKGTCVFRVAGSRWPVLSQFPNIFDAKCVAA